MGKKALVVSGGGAKGAFAVGVLDYLNSNNLLPEFDMFAGSSTGSLISTLMTVGALQTCIDIYTSTSNQDFGSTRDMIQAAAQNDSAFNTTGLFQLIQRTVTPDIATQILAGPKTLLLTTTCMQNSRSVYFQAGPSAASGTVPVPAFSDIWKLQTREELMLAMLASASEPAFMPLIPVMPTRDGNKQYCDGGARVVTPIEIAAMSLNAGDEIYAIMLFPHTPDPVTTQYAGFMDILMRGLDLYGDAVAAYNILLAQNLCDSRGITLHLIQTPVTLMQFGLEFDPIQMAKMMQQGRDLGAKMFPAPSA